ncbi:hypothetical protein F0562_017118 [Nyssa sinensis]|uniref:Cellulose synthase RING-type zinc finger domain-containing protein n=1 Tax=Nyssa sinensis TaxID=561372 RepID=A0A5J4ZGU7_9ASTE|nr:hypothetical protein F0562_017118 [Nyssa sinensis]
MAILQTSLTAAGCYLCVATGSKGTKVLVCCFILLEIQLSVQLLVAGHKDRAILLLRVLALLAQLSLVHKRINLVRVAPESLQDLQGLSSRCLLRSSFLVTSVKELSGQICQICGDEIEITVDGEPFVACNECAFPVCRPCYEYERREGNQAYPQCKTRFKRIKGDEEEDEFDDLDNEFDFGSNPQHLAEAVLASCLNTGRGALANVSGVTTPSELDSSSLTPDIPLLTYGQEDAGISADKHALIIPPFMSRAKRVHPMPFTDSSMSLPPRPMDPKKDLAVYGYGSVAWKDRMEEWKKRQNDKLQVVKHQGENGGGYDDGDELDDPDLPK